jgi:hypothetical protein
MAKKSGGWKGERLHRDDPDRDTPHRSGNDHFKRNARSGGGGGGGSGRGCAGSDGGGAGRPNGPKSLISESVQQAISNMVQLSSTVIEEQIRAGQTAAARLREGMANSQQLNTDVSMMAEKLVATTKDVGATWLELLSIVVRSIGAKSPDSGAPDGSRRTGTMQPTTRTRTGTSNGVTTVSNVTPADPATPAEPPQIVVTGSGVKNVTLDLRPPSPRFVPLVHELLAGDPKQGLRNVKFQLAPDKTHLVLAINVPRGQPAGTYTGAIVDSSTNEPGGTVSVTVGG